MLYLGQPKRQKERLLLTLTAEPLQGVITNPEVDIVLRMPTVQRRNRRSSSRAACRDSKNARRRPWCQRQPHLLPAATQVLMKALKFGGEFVQKANALLGNRFGERHLCSSHGISWASSQVRFSAK